MGHNNTNPTHNGRLAVQMEDARYCLADLARRGLRIASVEIGRLPKPRITLDAPYLQPAGLQGGMVHRTDKRTRYATDHKCCQVEWEVPA
jgi:hypothetical protein